MHNQQRKDKDKLYSAQVAEVEHIAKGKIDKRYEFGNKSSFVTTSKSNWVVGAQSLKGNPYDGHTLKGALEQGQVIAGRAAKTVYCDRGYRGHGVDGETTVKVVRHLPNRATRTTRNWMKRRAAIEPVIGHLKSDNRLNRNYLKGDADNKVNVLLAAVGYNLVKLIVWFYCSWDAVVMKEKPPKGGSYSNTEHPVQNIVLIMHRWINNKEKSLFAPFPLGDSSGTTK